MWIPTDYFFDQALLDLSEESPSAPFVGVLDGVYIGLAIQPLPGLGRSTVLSQLVEASFPGYARLPVVWRLPYFGENQLWDLEGQCVHWQPTGVDTGQVIWAAFLVTALSGGQLLMVNAFPSPGIDMSQPQAALTLVPRFGMDPAGMWGDCTPVD